MGDDYLLGAGSGSSFCEALSADGNGRLCNATVVCKKTSPPEMQRMRG
jgi:hypothetical protein